MSSYSFFQILHLISAVIFGGFVFAEVVLFPSIGKLYGKHRQEEAEYAIVKRGIKIIPLFFATLLITGTLMYLDHIHSINEMFATPFNIVLNIKVFLVLLVTVGILTAIVLFNLGRSEGKLFLVIHYVAFVLVFVIVVLAKVMYLV